MTQNNLGWALRFVGERRKDAGILREAQAAIAAAWNVNHEAGLVHDDDYYLTRLAEIDALIASCSMQDGA